MVNSISAAVHQVDPGVALAEPKTLDEVVDESMANQRFTLDPLHHFCGGRLVPRRTRYLWCHVFLRGPALA